MSEVFDEQYEKYLQDPRIPLEKSFVDERGEILPLINNIPVGSVVLITSKKGSIRANHYHKTDWHYCYVLSGSIDYYHRRVGDESSPQHFRIQKGELFFTPPMVEHTMCFPEDTVFICFGKNSREQNDYESDLVRVTLIENYQLPQ